MEEINVSFVFARRQRGRFENETVPVIRRSSCLTDVGPEFSGRVGARIPAGFAYLDASANGLYTAAGLDSGSVQLAGVPLQTPARMPPPMLV